MISKDKTIINEYDEMLTKVFKFMEEKRVFICVNPDIKGYWLWIEIRRNLERTKDGACSVEYVKILKSIIKYMDDLEIEYLTKEDNSPGITKEQYRALYLYLRDDLMNYYNASIKVVEEYKKENDEVNTLVSESIKTTIEKLVKNMAAREIEIGVDSTNE